MYCKCLDKKSVTSSAMGKSFKICSLSEGGCGKEIAGDLTRAAGSIHCGFDALMKSCGGLAAGINHYFCPIGRGESDVAGIALHSLARNLAAGRKVAAICVDEGKDGIVEDFVSTRVATILTGISTDKIVSGEMGRDELDVLSEFSEKHSDRLLANSYPEDTVERAARAALEAHQAEVLYIFHEFADPFCAPSYAGELARMCREKGASAVVCTNSGENALLDAHSEKSFKWVETAEGVGAVQCSKNNQGERGGILSLQINPATLEYREN